MNRQAARALGVIAGAIAGLIGVRLLNTRRAVIRIHKRNGECVSRTHPYRLPAKRWNPVQWDIEDPDNCLGESEIEIRFEGDDSPVVQKRPRGRRQINDRVRLLATPRVYKYDVWLVAPDGSCQLLEDPELQVEP